MTEQRFSVIPHTSQALYYVQNRPTEDFQDYDTRCGVLAEKESGICLGNSCSGLCAHMLKYCRLRQTRAR